MLRHAGNHAIANVSAVSLSLRLIAPVPICPPAARTLRNVGPRVRPNHRASKMQGIDFVLSNTPPIPPYALTARQSDINTINRFVPMLHQALVGREVAKAEQAWSVMTRKQVLRLIGRTTHEKHSRILAVMCKEAQSQASWTWTGEERAALGHMALVAASAGYPSGLTAFLLLTLQRKEPETALKLYESYFASLKEADTWSKAGETGEIAPKVIIGADGIDAEGEPLGDVDVSQENDFDVSVMDPDIPLVPPDVLLCAIAAHAMQNDFLGAVNTSLQTWTRVSKTQITFFSTRLPLEKEIRANVVQFAYRLETVRLAARPSSLFNYLTALINNLSHKQLKVLYTNFISELSSDSPWLTTDSRKVSDTTPVVLPDFAWGLLLKGFLYCRQLSMAGQLWDDMRRLGVTPSVSAWTGLLQGYSQLRLGPQLLNAWKLIQEDRFTPVPIMHQAFIEGLLRTAMIEEALQHLHQYRSSMKLSMLQDPTTLSIHNATISGLLHNDEEKEAKAILELMSTEQPHPDIATYNTFLRYYANKDDFKAVASVLEVVDKSKLRGDVFTFSTVLTALLKVRQGDAPQIVFDLMRRQGVKPNVVMYTGIIDHLMGLRTPAALTAGLDVLRTIEEDTSGDVAPNIATYTSVLKGVLSARWLHAAELEEMRRDIAIRMRRRKLKLNTTTYNVLIGTALENEDAQGVQLAMLYYKEMPKHMVKRDTWFVMLRGLSRRGELALAQKVLSDMKKLEFVPQQSLAKLISQIQNQIAGSRQATYDM